MKKRNKLVFISALTVWGLFSAILFLLEYKEASCWKDLAQQLNFTAYISCSITVNLCKILGIFELKYHNFRSLCFLFLLCQTVIYLLCSYLILKILEIYDVRKKQNAR